MANKNRLSAKEPGTDRCQTTIEAVRVMRAEIKRRIALIIICASIKIKKSPAIVVCSISQAVCNELTTIALYSVQATNGWMYKWEQTCQRCNHSCRNEYVC